jgi:Pyruvate/2-oxoacid:ferredoxin oxidoreductase delta subunit
MTQKDAYAILMERHGYPDSERYRRTMEYLMTPEQARIAVELPAPPEQLADKLQVPVATIMSELDELFTSGVVFPRNFQTREGYRFARNVMQLHDASQSSVKTDPVRERRLFELWEDFCHAEWYPDLAAGIARGEFPPTRVVPAYRAIKDIPGILACEDMREILKAAPLIGVCACSCRQRAGAVADRCEKSIVENCLQFGRGAEYAISRGSGRQLSYEEALAVIDAAEMPNSATMTANVMCSCCRDCCVIWVPMDEHGVDISKRWAKSRFEARVDWDLCNGCQDCVERCQFDAIEMVKPEGSKKYKAIVDPERCWGCGVCVLGCAPEALSMAVVRPPEHIPEAAPAT